MKLKNTYILLLLCGLLLAGCDSENNWFFHSVPYNAKVDKPEMVVIAQLVTHRVPKIYVSESVFFLDNKTKNSVLQDAEVQMRVNGGEPMTLVGGYHRDTTGVLRSYYSPEHFVYDVKSYYSYTCDYVLQAGDRVELTVRHKNYEKPVHVTQQMPKPVAYTMTYSGTTSVLDYESLADFTIRLAPTTQDSSCLLAITATTYCHDEDYYKLYTYEPPHYEQVCIGDTTEYDYDISRVVYSQGLSFVGYDRTNRSLSGGYYGAEAHGLFRAVNTDETTFTISVPYSTYAYERLDGGYRRTYLDSVTVDVAVVTRDYYLYTSSMFAAGNYWQYVPDYFGGQNEDIIGDISEIFDELGSMEGVQVYSNVENGIGHVTAKSSTRCTYVFDNTKN